MPYRTGFYSPNTNTFTVSNLDNVSNPAIEQSIEVPERPADALAFDEGIIARMVRSQYGTCAVEWGRDCDAIILSPDERTRLRQEAAYNIKMFRLIKSRKKHSFCCRGCNKNMVVETGLGLPSLNYVVVEIKVCSSCLKNSRKYGKKAMQLVKHTLPNASTDLMLEKSRPILVPEKNKKDFVNALSLCTKKDEALPYVWPHVLQAIECISLLALPYIIPLDDEWLSVNTAFCKTNWFRQNASLDNRGIKFPLGNRLTWYKCKKQRGVGMKQMFPGRSIKRDTLDRRISKDGIVIHAHDGKSDSDTSFTMVGWLSDAFPEEIIVAINKKMNARNYVMLWGIPEIGQLPSYNEPRQAAIAQYNIPVSMWVFPNIPSEIVSEMTNGFLEGYKKYLNNRRLQLSKEVS